MHHSGTGSGAGAGPGPGPVDRSLDAPPHLYRTGIRARKSNPSKQGSDEVAGDTYVTFGRCHVGPKLGLGVTVSCFQIIDAVRT